MRPRGPGNEDGTDRLYIRWTENTLIAAERASERSSSLICAERGF